ncbi:MAG TPA: 7TM diverse intracellular signaling domain-containing protein [Puia sp.]|nr:7TM diverse intracellular signaling domain-containing protein [Puia sp.]
MRVLQKRTTGPLATTILLLLVAMTTRCHAQTLPVAGDLAKTGLIDDISANTWLYFSRDKELSPGQLSTLPFKKGTTKYEHFMPPALVDRKAILRFTLTNSSDTLQSAWFCPGFLVSGIRLYRQDGPVSARTDLPGEPPPVIAVPDVMPDDADSLGYRKVTLGPHETATYYAVLTYIKASSNWLTPSLTRESLIGKGILLQHRNKTSIDIITNLFAGIMLMMIFYAISEYLQSGKPEFLYYIGYSLCISVLLFLKATLHQTATRFNFIFESFFDNIIFSAGYICYIVFHRKFLETSKYYKALDRFLFWGCIGVTILTCSYVVAYFFAADFQIANNLEVSTKLLLLAISVVFILKGLSYRNRLMSYIVMGNISLCLLSIMSQAMISMNIKVVKSTSVLNSALFYYEAGITIELLFFLFALTYKNKMEIILSTQKEEKLKLETERKEMEKQVAVLAAKQDERNRISVDMHDELGSGVTAIRLMSEIVKSKMKDQTLPEIEKISNSANELLNKMNTIIWTMTSSNDTVENLVAYIRSYAVEFFENTSIDCYFTMPAAIPAREINGEKRRNIFLSVKEALNNVLKHSQSSVVKINIEVDEQLVIEIHDDGVGINLEKLRKFGNGLNNMKKRMASIDGEFNIENRHGTKTTFYLQL